MGSPSTDTTSGGAGPDVWRRCADLCGGAERLTAAGRRGNTVFTFSLNATTGAWTFNLEDQLDHPTLDGLPGDNTENDLTIHLGALIQATDLDGDTVTGNATGLVVTVNDDTPIRGAISSGTVDEDGLPGRHCRRGPATLPTPTRMATTTKRR